MLVSCLLLVFVRAIVICFGVYFPPPRPQDQLVWLQAKPIDPSRKDLLSTPMLYYFCDKGDVFGMIQANVFEHSLFNNRDVTQLIHNNFIPVKVERLTNTPDPVFDELSQRLSHGVFPCMVVALPDGTSVTYTSWQTDRMLIAVLKDALVESSRTAAQDAMQKGDFAMAAQSYAKHDSQISDHYWAIEDYRLGNAVHWYIALKHEGRDKEAAKVLEDTLSIWSQRYPRDQVWPVFCLRYLFGQLPAEDLLKQAEKDKETVTANYLIGVQSKFKGNLGEAKKHLLLAVCKRENNYRDDYKYARTELRLMGEKIPEEE
jgi:hypothetical protein